MLVALSVWPLLGFVPQLESLVANGLLLGTYYQLAFLTVTNVVAFFFAISVLRLLNSRTGRKCSNPMRASPLTTRNE